MMVAQEKIVLAERLASRLERLSVDSYWAHRASGLRGSLLKSLEVIDISPSGIRTAHLDILIQQGFEILEKAASKL